MLMDIPCLLCIVPFDGSSRRMRFTKIFSSCSENHPLGRCQALVFVGDGGIMNTDQIPKHKVRIPSIRKLHFVSAIPVGGRGNL